MNLITQLWYLPLGFIPSLLWLSYYLRKDVHPEPNRLIVRVFFLGMLSAPLAALLSYGAQQATHYLPLSSFATSVVFVFVGIGFVEEFVKYYIIRSRMMHDPDFDEPVDAMIYLIISGLGFAALENILILSQSGQEPFASVVGVLAMRFASATFFHALASGIVGYFLALSLLRQFNRRTAVLVGLLIAGTLHGIYDYVILYMTPIDLTMSGIFIVTLLLGMAIGVRFAFKKLQHICFVLVPIRSERERGRYIR